VSAAASDILKEGGNAFDAVVAAGFASAVAEPALTSLGGGGFLLAKTKEKSGDSREILFDFFVNTPGLGLEESLREPHFFPVTVHFPGSDQDFNVGLGSVAVPGNLKGYLHVHRRLGRLSLQKILRPAVRLATEGVIINDRQAYFLKLLRPIMLLSPTGQALSIIDGQYISSGKRQTQPELAAFLGRLPEDHGESLYHGKLAEAVAEDMRAGRGLLTSEDLEAYQVIERVPLAIKYRGHTLLTNPPPSMGGTLVALALSLLEVQSMQEFSWGETEHLLQTAGLMHEIERFRGQEVTSSDLQKAGQHIRLWSRGTTHISVADTEGNVASMTASNGEGSGYYVPNTGIMLNNMMGEDDLHPDGFHASPPCQRVASMMSPSILVKAGVVELALGSGGSKRIRTAMTQVISNIVDFNLPLHDAVEAPRIHWDGNIMQVEPGLPESAVNALRKHWPVNVWADKDMYFGGVHAVIPGKAGAGDPRRGGAVAEVDFRS